MFIRFPAILLVKTTDSYLHELCTGYFTKQFLVTWSIVKEHAIESRTTSLKTTSQQHRLNQRRRTHENVTDRREMETEQPVFGHFGFFQRWQLKVE